MEIKIEFKAIETKVIDDFEESVKNVFQKLSAVEKIDLKHRIMNMKMQSDLIEKELKTLTQVLTEANKPKEQVQQKKVEPVEAMVEENTMEIDL